MFVDQFFFVTNVVFDMYMYLLFLYIANIQNPSFVYKSLSFQYLYVGYYVSFFVITLIFVLLQKIPK